MFYSCFLLPPSLAYYEVDIDTPKRHELVSSQSPVRVSGHISTNETASQASLELSVSADCFHDSSIDWTKNFTLPAIPQIYECYIPPSVMDYCKTHAMSIFTVVRKHGREVASAAVTVDVMGDGTSIGYLICSCISVIGCSTLIYLYIAYPVLRRFPSNLVFWRTVVDLIFALQFIWLNAWEVSETVGSTACNWVIAFITQFSIMASLDWYVVMAVNFYFSIENPFVKPQSKTMHYHIAAWGWAIVTAIVAATRFGYRDDFRLCWIKRSVGINIVNWAVYFIWIAVFGLICLISLFYGARKLSQDSEFAQQTLKTRQETLRQTRIYVVVFTLYWMSAAVIWFGVFITSQGRFSFYLSLCLFLYHYAFVYLSLFIYLCIHLYI